jgi:lysophospholipase L1-like esterase
MSGFGIRAASSLSSAAFPVSYVNDAVSGRTTADTFADGANHIRMLNPDVAVIQCWSENDGAWEKPARAALDRTKELVEIAAAAGCAPILCTAAPVFAHRPDIEKARDWSNNQVRSWSESGIAMLDLDRLWSNGAIPAAYRPEFNSGDDRHPNDHACAVAGVALANLLRRLYSL